MRFVKFLAFFLLLAGDVSSKPASLEANTPVVGCDGRVNILLAPEVFSQTVKHCGGSFWLAVNVTGSSMCLHHLRTSEGGVQEARSQKVCTCR